jgi:pimeloyl-ACP methyl ester carboxylesterase
MPVGFRMARIPVFNRISETLTPRSMVEDGVKDVYADPSRVTGALVDRYFELLTREGNRRALNLRLQQIATDLAPERIRTLKLPTLILWVAQDHLVPPVNAHRFQQDIAGSQLVIFPHLGHVPQEEDAQASVVPVRAFLGLDPPAGAASDPASGARPPAAATPEAHRAETSR